MNEFLPTEAQTDELLNGASDKGAKIYCSDKTYASIIRQAIISKIAHFFGMKRGQIKRWNGIKIQE